MNNFLPEHFIRSVKHSLHVFIISTDGLKSFGEYKMHYQANRSYVGSTTIISVSVSVVYLLINSNEFPFRLFRLWQLQS